MKEAGRGRGCYWNWNVKRQIAHPLLFHQGQIPYFWHIFLDPPFYAQWMCTETFKVPALGPAGQAVRRGFVEPEIALA